MTTAVNEDSNPLRTYAAKVALGMLAFLAVVQFVNVASGWAGWRSTAWRRIPIRGPEADHIAMNTIASEIARHPVTVSCVVGLFEKGEAGQAVPGGAVATLDKRVCIDLGHFARETPSSIACAVSDPHRLCRGTINQELDAMEVLAHESIHLLGYTNEATTDCYARQLIAQVAERLAAPRDEAHRLLHYYNDHFDAIRRPQPDYVSKECRPGGKLDLRPQTPAWPD